MKEILIIQYFEKVEGICRMVQAFNLNNDYFKKSPR